MSGIWGEWSVKRRALFVLAVSFIILISGALYMLLTQRNYVPVFDNLSMEQASKVTEKLNELKIDYELDSGGEVVMVEEHILPEVKLKLAANNLNLSGATGFELFDEADFGMTEFSQKINYQRALQGELTRTIMALEEVKYARVHLVLPESSLFRNNDDKTKASVTLVLEDDEALSSEQIQGIQNLVSSSVRGLSPDMVTVLNHRGVSLAAEVTENQRLVDQQLKGKRSLEDYLQFKAEELLTPIFGSGKYVVRIDVALGYQKIERVRETLLPFMESGKGGVVSRNSTKHYGDSSPDKKKQNNSLDSENVEEQFLYGKEVESLLDEGGSVERISISVVVPVGTPIEQLNLVESLLSSAVGLNSNRGDSIVVAPLGSSARTAISFDAKGPDEYASLGLGTKIDSTVVEKVSSLSNSYNSWGSPRILRYGILILAITSILLMVLLIVIFNKRPARMSNDERELLLDDVRKWLAATD